MMLQIPGSRRPASRHRAMARWCIPVCIATLLAGGASGCRDWPDAVLTQLMDARRLVADLRVQFTKAADASNRAVMAYSDEGAASAAREAEAATQAVQRDALALQPLLQKLAYVEESRHLEEFNRRFAEYRTLDSSILGLAVENTNLKAQRLSFGPAREAADAVHDSLEGIARSPVKDTCRVEALVAKAVAAVREIQVLQAPHIAEADDAAMSRMEQQMATAEAAARSALGSLKSLVPPAAGPALAGATTALDRFTRINTELIALSRRNSNVRSLALSLGRKRTLTAACDESLHALQEALSKRGFTATR
jgi:hypothetical protein